jgi:hypothetical protein
MSIISWLIAKFKPRNEHKTCSHNSLHIYYSAKNDSISNDTKTTIEASELEIDINIWKLKEHSNRITYIDFGLKVQKPNVVGKIFLYFPFKIDEQRFDNLGDKLSNVELLNGIFNRRYSIAQATKGYVVSDRESHEEVFSIYSFDVNSDVKFEPRYYGTIMSFDVKPEIAGIPVYYRFRICPENGARSDSFGSFFNEYRPNNTFFQSAMNITEITDFHINEARNQEKTLMESIQSNKSFMIRAINFFHIAPIIDVLIPGSQLQYQRQLESDGFWKDYLDCQKELCEGMCVYRCKIKPDGINHKDFITDFSIFYKVERRKSNLLSLIKYIIAQRLMIRIFSENPI